MNYEIGMIATASSRHSRNGATMKSTGRCTFSNNEVTRGIAIRLASVCSLLAIGAFVLVPQRAVADQSGVSFWLPGTFGSLAAVPVQPGLSAAMVYYHTTVSAGGDVSASREVQIGGTGVTVKANLNANLNATGDLVLFAPSYTFATPVLGGQAAVSLTGIYGRMNTSLAGTLWAGVGGIGIERSGQISDALTGVGDLYPQATLKWNSGVHNFMTYVMGDIPVGAYDPTRLSNIGIGHGAIDSGVGYTYFDPTKGHEFSAVAGLTYNLTNTSTNYQNGVDFHLDWGASQFLSQQFFVGAVGYLYNQIGCDSGSGDRVGCFQSRVASIGPQIGFIFPVGNMQGYLGLKGYWEFAAQNRPEGWNTWLTFAISPAAPTPPAPQSNLVRK
jgi:hypothetical protein